MIVIIWGIDKIFMDYIVVTSGALYLDIDAYACCVAMKELLRLKGQNAIAYSSAVCNYSVCQSLTQEGEIIKVLPEGFLRKECKYILVDVSDPKYIEKSISIEKVIGIYDHHIGFEEYWESRIRDKSHIEFIGAAASLIFQEWKVSGLFEKMKRSTALLLIAAILDNTLNLTSSNTSAIDIDAFNELCKKESVDEKWCSLYFSEVQENIECDLKNALFNDIVIEDIT